jgi:hypothetical protein
MRFFFPDSQDQVDPGFDFVKEEYSAGRMRQRDDAYTHEVLGPAIYSGILVSKSVVDGLGGLAGKYTFSQRQRFYTDGVRRFFRLDAPGFEAMQTFGDCGAFSYVDQEKPPYSVDEVLDFYEYGGFDMGVSMDHVILAYRNEDEKEMLAVNEIPGEWIARQQLTLELAAECMNRHKARHCRFELLGAAQGWDPASYAHSVKVLEEIGFKRIALGGLVPLKTPELLNLLRRVSSEKRKETEFHLFGISRAEFLPEFSTRGVTSFDSTSAFRKAFKDNRNNYHFHDRNYTAIRVPMVDGSPKLKKSILAGQVGSTEAVLQERRCLEILRDFDIGRANVAAVLDELRSYEVVCCEPKSRCDEYQETLQDAPWKRCGCPICCKNGIEVAIFRGSERNKRRGMHNLHVFRQRMNELV